MPNSKIILALLVVLALFNTVLLAFELGNYHPWASSSSPYGPSEGSFILNQLQTGSLALAPFNWSLFVGAWIWRGRIRFQWTRLGLTEDLFRLLKKMRGSETRTSILLALDTPKDRFQLAKDLGLDWTTVNYQISVLLRYGLVVEDVAYGNVKLYRLTPVGAVLLNAVLEMGKKEGLPHPSDANDAHARTRS